MHILKVSKNKNLGDGVVYFGFIQLLCKNDKLKYVDLKKECPETNYISIGSVLRNCDENSIICGTGFISADADLGSLAWSFTNTVYRKPKEILFVRGAKTREKLISMGVQCDEKLW